MRSIGLPTTRFKAWTIAYKSDQNIYHDHPILYVLVFGLIGAKLTNRLVVAHMCKGEITHRDASLLAPLLLFLNQYFNSYIPEIWLLNLSIVSIHRVNTKSCLLGCLTVSQMYLFHWKNISRSHNMSFFLLEYVALPH